MVKAGNDVKRDHSEARRYRYGFHAHRQPALSKRREEHRHEYAELRQAYLANYVNFVASVEKENRYKRKQYEAELLEWENQGAYKEGLTMAWRHLLLLSALDSTLAAQAGACRGLKGGPARAKSLTSNQRQEIAKKGTAARWGKS